MRIWILNHYACQRHGTGLTSHAVLAHYLRAMGHEPVVFPAAFAQVHAPAARLSPRRLFADCIDDGTRFRFIRAREYHSTLGRFWNMRSYARNVVRATDDLPPPDVVIGSLAHPFAVEAAWRLARRRGAKFVYEIRDIWPQSLIDLGSLSPWHPICRYFARLERQAFRRADAVMSVLPGIAEYAATHGVPADRVLYLPNGIDPAIFPELAEPPADGPFVISCFGRFGSGNDMDTIVAAAETLHQRPEAVNIRIRLVGDGPSKTVLERRAAAAGLTNIEFLGLVGKHELVELSRESHAFVHAHRRMSVVERYGMSVNKVFGFMAAGRPVLFACRSSYDPIREARAGLTVEPEDPAALAQAMFELSRTPDAERRAMGARARQHVLQYHDLSKLARRLDAFLADLVSAPRLPATHRRAA
ncbi:MAG TPA: hypothetical protein DD670_09005 [Planctomycetaceae bacterium]|nr:hypothetical protein [Planctomycetaceae bacterium]